MKQDILETMAAAEDGVYAVDMDQRIAFWNQQAERILGYSAKEMLGRPCYEAFGGVSEEGAVVCKRNCATVLLARRGRVAASHTFRARARDGTPKWINATHVLLPAARPELGTLVHVFHDASEDVAARRLIENLRGLLSGRPGTPSTPVAASTAENPLSPREAEVVRLLARGASTADVANELVISPTTVRNHVQRVLTKLGVHSRLEAVVAASRLRLL